METPLRNVRTNIVQSIRAFRVHDLQQAAQQLGQHFLYANLSAAQSKQDVLDMIAAQFMFPSHFGKNFDALYDCITDLKPDGDAEHPGFAVILQNLPAEPGFPADERDVLLDVFRDAADFFFDHQTAFRVFYSVRGRA